MTLPELLAPAGSASALHAAVRSGADAVYLGLGAFNARRNADNFNAENIGQACDYAHLRGVKVYITMNTIVLPGEMREALECAACAYDAGVDAFIVQDIGLASALKRALPDARLHISTQMNIHSESGIEAAAELGASRATLARELSIAEIARLAEKARELGMQVETFAHGALCVCYSGQCFMSSMIGGRSANRGLCAQACRLNYSLIDGGGEELQAPGEFLLSPKDLCSIDLIQQLIEAGVSSLKIEGRMKSPEYVQSVVSVYRDVLDRIGSDGSASAEEGERKKLASAFSRGFTTAYLEGDRGNDIMSYQRPNNRGQFIGRVKWVRGNKLGIACEQRLVPGDVIEIWTKRGRSAIAIDANAQISDSFAEIAKDDKARVYESDRVFRVRSAEAAFEDADNEPRVPVVGSVRLKIGEPLQAQFRLANMSEGGDDGVDRTIIGEAIGPVVEPARSKEVTAEDVLAHVDRLGTTPFCLEQLDIQLGEGVGIGFSQIHHVRAEALDDLKEKLLAPYRGRKKADLDAIVRDIDRTRRGRIERQADLAALEIVALASNPDCAHAAKRAGAACIYVPALNYKRGMAELKGCATPEAGQTSYPKRCTIVLPVVDHDAQGSSREEECGIDVWQAVSPDSRLLVQNIGDMRKAAQMGAHFEIGSHLPITNAYAARTADDFGAACIWLSPELNLAQIEDLAKHCEMPLGAKIFGAQELMTTEHCMLASQGPCNEDCALCSRRMKPHFLKDRKGYEFPVVSDALGRSHIYNSVKLDSTPELSRLIEAGITRFMVDTTLMNVEETAQAVGRCVRAMHLAISGEEPQKRMPDSTSGHLHRGVM